MPRLRIVIATWALVVLVALPRVADAAITWPEAGDAGQVLGTSQAIPTPGVDRITGSFSTAEHIDLYRFWLPDGSFFASTVNADTGVTTLVDTQLYLFDGAGIGLAGNDDFLGDGLQSRVDKAFLPEGLYYLGISSYNWDPISVAGLIFPDSSSFGGEAQWEPTGVGQASPLWSWQSNSGSGSTTSTGPYTIVMSETAKLPMEGVPEPCSLAFLGLGAGLAAWRRRRAR
jgi:hypothetical protein